ncbi:Ig-like domain-containing protein [Persicitalea sp.]|uniref:Ig-like domain-containing protein n=1 Tax=Persicitalea sp. TaxID=3100273 RepID=UPI003593E805
MKKRFHPYHWLIVLIGTVGFAQQPQMSGNNYLPGQVIHDPNNPTKMVYNRDLNKDGQLDPFFLCGPGDPEGFLYRGKRNPNGTRSGDQVQLVKKMVQYGGNSAYVVAVRTNGGDATKSHEKDPTTYPDVLHNPWIDQDNHKGLNQDILDQWEMWFAKMDNSGILIYFFIYDDGIRIGPKLGWPLDDQGNLHSGEKAFVQGLVKRFKHHKRLIWCIMEEDQEIGKDWQAHVSKIAEAIHEADDHNHIIATHQHGGNIFYHKGDPYISQFALQTDKKVVIEKEPYRKWMREAYANTDGMYSVVMSEDYVHGQFSIPNNSREECRQRNWIAAMASTYVMVLGMDIANTPREWLNDCKIIQTFFERTNFNQMIPNDSLATHETESVLVNPGYDYILYGANATRTLGINHLEKGRYTLRWLDCISGKINEQKHILLKDGANDWAKPSGFGKEVALYLEREDKRPVAGASVVAKRSSSVQKAAQKTVPEVESVSIKVAPDREVSIQLAYSDPDGGPGPYTFTIVSKPKHGVLTGVGNDRVYKPNKGFKGVDQFSWKVNDGSTDSNKAVITINVE